MPNYENGKIYIIRCRTDNTLIYVGSTIQPLCERFAQHKRCSKREINKKKLIYETINDDWNNWYIELHSLYPCNHVEELRKKEGEIIREIGTLNMEIAGRTKQEYYKDHKQEISEKNKRYYETNKEEILTNHKKWYETNKELIISYQKIRYEAKREKLLLQKKEYYNNNADKIKEKVKKYKEKKKAEKLNSIQTP